MARVLYMGVALDGPSNEMWTPQSREDLLKVHGIHVQRFTVSPTASSVTLDYEPLYIDDVVIDGRRDILHAPAISGNIFSFSPIGSGDPHVMDIYYVPDLGDDDLVKQALYHFNIAEDPPTIMRVGGTRATYTSPGGWKFEAKWPGSKYNNIQISYTALDNTLTITGLAPEYPDITLTGTVDDISLALNKKFNKNLSPVMVVENPTNDLDFTGNLSGGTDGAIDENSLEFILDMGLPSTVSHVIIPTLASSSLLTPILNYVSAEKEFPALFFVSVPTPTLPASSWVLDLADTLPTRSDLICLVSGRVSTGILGQEIEIPTTVALGPVLQFIPDKSVTNIPLIADWADTSELTKPDLAILKEGGVICPTLRIYGGVAIYEAVTSNNTKSFVYANTFVELAHRVTPLLMPFLGSPLPLGPVPQIEQIVASVAGRMPFFKLDNVETLFTREGVLYVTVYGKIHKEILQFNFIIRNRAAL